MLFPTVQPSQVRGTIVGQNERKDILVLGEKERGDGHTVTNCNMQAVSERLFSRKEVSQHCEPHSCWVVVNNTVYDLTEFIYKHPAGEDMILEHAGLDCTSVFQDVGHSKNARNLLAKYKIGLLTEEERTSTVQT